MSGQAPPPPPPVNRNNLPHPSPNSIPSSSMPSSSTASRRAELDDELSEIDLGGRLDVRERPPAAPATQRTWPV
eukprot:IDg12781t1